jgi:Zn-dependent M28 family amino/carboxypeptidase
MGAIVIGCSAPPSSAPADPAPLASTSSQIAPTSDSAIASTAGQVAAARFDSARAWKDLEAQVAFGPRPAGSAALQKTREYILAELKKAGIATRQQIFIARTPLGETSMANVIATIPGRRPERVALASHFDTKLFKDFRFVGASDGASSTAALLELARGLSGRQNEFTLELIFFDGEEAVVEWGRNNDNTYGSRYYVEAAQRDGSIKGLRALVLLDMIGDKDLLIRRDAASTPWLVDTVWAAAARIGHRSVFSNELTTIDDDHMPFIRAGIPAVDIIDLDYPAWHTAADTLENVSARSLQIVGDVVLAALPDIEARLR